jgi:hypothetical protein
MKKNIFITNFFAFTFLICFSVSVIAPETTPELKNNYRESYIFK